VTQTLGLVLFAVRAVLLLLFGLVYGVLSVLLVVVPLTFLRDLVDRGLLGILIKVVGFTTICTNTTGE